MTEIQDLLKTFRSVQQRMILHDSLLTRQAGSVPSLQSLARDAVLLILSTNNTQVFSTFQGGKITLFFAFYAFPR